MKATSELSYESHVRFTSESSLRFVLRKNVIKPCNKNKKIPIHCVLDYVILTSLWRPFADCVSVVIGTVQI